MDPATLDAAVLRELLRALAHDLRNPLSAVVTNLEFAQRLLARSESADPDLRESLVDSSSACDVLRRLVSNLDLLARRPSASVHEVSVPSVVQEVVSRSQGSADQVEVEIEVALPDGRDRDAHRALLDRALFALALENLLANALQYAPRGSRVRVALVREGGELCVHVRDGGGAIPLELRARAVAPEGNTIGGRQPRSRYGRGLALLAAAVAAEATDARVEIGGEGEESLLSLRARASDVVIRA